MANIGTSPAKRAGSSSPRQGWNRAGGGTPSPRSSSSQWTRKNSSVSPLTRWVSCRRPGSCATCRGFATRILEADEMARAVLFPAGPSATYFAGADLDVTGGQLAQRRQIMKTLVLAPAALPVVTAAAQASVFSGQTANSARTISIRRTPGPETHSPIRCPPDRWSARGPGGCGPPPRRPRLSGR